MLQKCYYYMTTTRSVNLRNTSELSVNSPQSGARVEVSVEQELDGELQRFTTHCLIGGLCGTCLQHIQQHMAPLQYIYSTHYSTWYTCSTHTAHTTAHGTFAVHIHTYHSTWHIHSTHTTTHSTLTVHIQHTPHGTLAVHVQHTPQHMAHSQYTALHMTLTV